LSARGLDDSYFADNVSESTVDTLVAWGDEDCARRPSASTGGGRDHVCIHALYADPVKTTLEWTQYRL